MKHCFSRTMAMTLTLSLAVISFCGSSFAASSNDTNVSGAGFEAIESSEKVKQELMAQYGENKPIMDGDYDKSLAVKCVNGHLCRKKDG